MYIYMYTYICIFAHVVLPLSYVAKRSGGRRYNEYFITYIHEPHLASTDLFSGSSYWRTGWKAWQGCRTHTACMPNWEKPRLCKWSRNWLRITGRRPGRKSVCYVEDHACKTISVDQILFQHRSGGEYANREKNKEHRRAWEKTKRKASPKSPGLRKYFGKKQKKRCHEARGRQNSYLGDEGGHGYCSLRRVIEFWQQAGQESDHVQMKTCGGADGRCDELEVGWWHIYCLTNRP